MSANLRLAGKIAAAIVIALALGLGSAWWVLSGDIRASGLQAGAWNINTSIGSVDAGPYVRAATAVMGLFALNRSEAIYYMAWQDDEGHALSGDCTYEVEGTEPPGRWWSITAYGSDHYLIDNPQDRYSFNVASLGLDEAQTGQQFAFMVSPAPQDGHWLPVKAGDAFSLTLRIYNPDEALVEDPGALEAPAIRRVSCSADAGGAS